ncbi:MAG: hypothetical protein K2J95_02075 [Lachnospiraceae bacterium]|nr:hypothetical protein [Lachnospiraceae bacterium]
MELNDKLKELLLGRVEGRQKEEMEGMINEFHNKLADGSVSKAEVAAISFKIASCMNATECENAARWIKDLFM